MTVHFNVFSFQIVNTAVVIDSIIDPKRVEATILDLRDSENVKELRRHKQ